MSIQVESDLKDILNKFDQKLDKLDGKLDKLTGDVTDIKVSLAEVKGDLKATDEKLSGQIKTLDTKLSGQIKALDTQVEQLDKRVGNQEFTGFINCGSEFRRRPLTNRGVLVGLIVVILGGAAKFFGMLGNR